MINDTEDFFDLDDFAEMVTLNNKKVKAIFDIAPVTHNNGFAEVASYTPTLLVQTVDVEKAKLEQGSKVIVRKNEYQVADMNDDGTGITTVILYTK